MRTTLTIDDYLMQSLKDLAHKSGKPLKQVVNNALRSGIEVLSAPAAAKQYQCKTFSMGYPPRGNLDKALDIVAAIEDEELSRKLALRK